VRTLDPLCALIAVFPFHDAVYRPF
jgi:hypothetical protein